MGWSDTLLHVTACVLWEKYVDPEGYGRCSPEPGKTAYAHRRAWEEAHGPIPKGLTIHHRCGTKVCLTVDHMELRSNADHSRLHALEKWAPGGALRDRS